MFLKCIGKMLQDLLESSKSNGTAHSAVLILPVEHLWISAGSWMLCSETPVLGTEQDEECLLLPLSPVEDCM